MSTTPVIPPRPVRSQAAPQQATEAAPTPQVPPRPVRASDRSISRDREASVRSPLNDSPFLSRIPSREAGGPPARPPSVNSLPLIGQEGMEYASLSYGAKMAAEGAATPNETRNVAGDLPLHAPRASGPSQTATVTSVGDGPSDSVSSRRQSTGGKYSDSEDVEPSRRPPSARLSGQHHGRSPSTGYERSVSRAESIHGDDALGIPEIGVQVPLLHMAGDVQAPSPAPISAERLRRRSAHDLVPPGSYGLHGHGSGPMDKFDSEWYQKHPEELAKEGQGAYGPGMSSVRGDYVMSSELLNKMVRESGSRGATATGTGLPPEAYGYGATADEIAAGAQSPMHRVRSRPGSVHVDSPLRQNFSTDDPHNNLESETDDEHLTRPPLRPQSRTKSSWFHSQDDLHRQLHQHNLEEQPEGYHTPILADDEVAKNPLGGFIGPAVTSEDARSRELFQSHLDYEAAQEQTRSRSASRPNSVQGQRFNPYDHHNNGSNSHLAGVEEYEPLFKDPADGNKLKKIKDIKDKAKRMELGRFPSRDIWEDTPDSLRLETEVGTPEPEPGTKVSYFETPSQEQARSRPDLAEAHRSSFLDDAHAKAEHAAVQGLRPSAHRFPSRDIWEDTPDSSYLVTTVGSEDEEGPVPATKTKPTIPPRPSRVKPVDPSEIVESTSPDKKSAPSIPERPKPQVPPRPQRAVGDATSAQSLSQSKPPVPSSSSSKFSNIKAGFMNDLNSRLKLGPQAAPKPSSEDESEQEKVPLTDARKGRAKGPQRRNPPAAAAAATAPAPSRQIATGWSISKPWTVWSISEEKELEIGQVKSKAPEEINELQKEEEAPTSSPLSTNTAGESLERPDAAPRAASGALAHPSNADMDIRAQREEQQAKVSLTDHTISTIGAAGDVPEPIVDQPHLVSEKAATSIETPFTEASTGDDVLAPYEPPSDGGRPHEEKTEAEGGLSGQ